MAKEEHWGRLTGAQERMRASKQSGKRTLTKSKIVNGEMSKEEPARSAAASAAP